MKTILSLLLLVAAGITGGCNRSVAESVHDEDEMVTAAMFKAGHGLRLTPLAREFNGIETAAFTGALPAAALLHTVEGSFVYVENDGWLLRTPVVVGAQEGSSIGIKEGLYEGDRVAVRGVTALWLAELHVLRAGQACAHEG